MIFDSPQMVALREKYRDFPNYEVPEIVFLDRYEGYAGERELIEELIGSVSELKQRDWLGRLISEDPSQHIGVWFEIMLFGWLQERYKVLVEPEILGCYPDFVLEFRDVQLAIEARAFLITPDERDRRSRFNRIITSLGSIEKPFSVVLEIKRLGGKIAAGDFVGQVVNWLESSPEENFVYHDDLGNVLGLSAAPRPNMKKLGVLSSDAFSVNPDALKPALSEKAGQHKALRKAGFPYVIAVLLEPSHLSAEEMSEAWLGRTTIVYDPNFEQVIEEKVDESGIHFFGDEIRHKSVTGTLVFGVDHDIKNKTRYLRSWYVQNPYANVIIDPTVFPAESRFIIVGQNEKAFEMKWVL